ncbi:hypothetical protein [Edaphobacter acidisoli]|uniref:hypothetical protein n=1 Tax=Edaphobacter acidisoli TaxID=2040573 RepID=UPI0016637121|nr:hypothetical protein [Edaphobacter acidisoli]
MLKGTASAVPQHQPKIKRVLAPEVRRLPTPMNSNETAQTKKPLSKTAKIIIMEIAMVLGCFVAMFTVSPATPLRTFLIICVAVFIAFNLFLFIQLRKPANPARKINTKKIYILTGLSFLILAWEIYRNYGR